MNQMDKYEIDIFWSEEDGCFLAQMPELPGCMADGETREDALRNIQVIAREWIATAHSLGRPIPAPKPHEEPLTHA